MKNLKKLNKEIKNCKKCSLWTLRKNVVPGEGPAHAKIMVLGIGPGVEEDKTGRPFIGRSGQLLNQLLERAKIKREEVFITSVLKCLPQPPVNRKPKREEIKACLPWLNKQIEIINPPKFILLGEVVFSLFFPKKKLKDLRGKRLKKEKKEFFVTYHPAAGLRFPKIKKILEKDFQKIKNMLK